MKSITSLRLLATFAPKNLVITRTLASTAQPTDPIQKLFVDKIREYASKSKSVSNGLVDANADVAKKLSAEMERVANLYGVKNEKDIANLGLKFEETIKLDPINLIKK